MNEKLGQDQKARNNPLWMWLLACAFCTVSAVCFLSAGAWMEGLACLGTVLLVTLPVAAERLFGLRMSRGFFVFCLLYALGPMLGKAYKLYYITSWWDKLLHTCGGVVFAILGYYLAGGLNHGQPVSPVLRAVFGLCFSVAVSAVWELYEYGVDCFFAADMQHDTVISTIHSHYLSASAGGLHTISGIRDVVLDGVPLEIGGYLDIGLIDTMHDMLVETLGALAASVWFLADRDRHPLIRLAPARGCA